MNTRAEPYTDPSPADMRPAAMPSGPCEVGESSEPCYGEPTFLCAIPAGAQLIAVGGKVIVVAPSMAPCYVTPTGLKPIFNPRESNVSR
jgi:hypothetical protein